MAAGSTAQRPAVADAYQVALSSCGTAWQMHAHHLLDAEQEAGERNVERSSGSLRCSVVLMRWRRFWRRLLAAAACTDNATMPINKQRLCRIAKLVSTVASSHLIKRRQLRHHGGSEALTTAGHVESTANRYNACSTGSQGMHRRCGHFTSAPAALLAPMLCREGCA